MNINLNLYKYFYEVAKNNSFTKASEKLLISQPALSYSIKTLENQLGIKLFNRINNKIKLTYEGEKLFDKLGTIFKELKVFEDDQADEYTGKIIIGARLSYINRILSCKVADFNVLYPKIDIKFLPRDREDFEELLISEKVDIVIDDNFYFHKYEENVKQIKIRTSKTALIANSKFINDFNGKIIDKEYFNQNKIMMVLENSYSKKLYETLNEKSRTNVINCGTSQVMLDRLSKENIIAHIPFSFIEKDVSEGKVIVLNTSIELPEALGYATYLSSKEDKKINAFLHMVKDCD